MFFFVFLLVASLYVDASSQAKGFCFVGLSLFVIFVVFVVHPHPALAAQHAIIRCVDVFPQHVFTNVCPWLLCSSSWTGIKQLEDGVKKCKMAFELCSLDSGPGAGWAAGHWILVYMYNKISNPLPFLQWTVRPQRERAYDCWLG